MKWLGVKTIHLESLVLPGNWKRRLANAQDTAQSIAELGNEPINYPTVWWFDTETKKKPRELCAGGDRVAALAFNGAKALEVKAFEGTREDFLKVRAHENAKRRNDDRDAWLRSLTDADERDRLVEGGEMIWHGVDRQEAEPEATHSVINEQVVRKLPGAAKPGRPQTAKGAAREAVAATVGTTPAAVRQAELRDRKKQGEVKPREARKVHNDSGPALSEAANALVVAIANVAQALQHQQAAIGRIMERHPALDLRANPRGVLEMVKAAAAELRAMTPVAVCCYCLDAPTEDCHACKNDRFLFKSQLRDAPEEMRKRVA